MRYLKYFLLSVLCVGFLLPADAHINPNLQGRPSQANSAQSATRRMDCSAATSQIDLDINNVRARLLVGGDIWWNGDDGLYVVPKPPVGSGDQPVSSLFAGAVWLGGVDPGLGLKVAAQTYGTSPNQNSTDFWPGPLDETGSTADSICSDWDRFFVVNGSDIDLVRAAWAQAVANQTFEIPVNEIPVDILGWPANGNTFFFDVNEFELPSTIQGLAPFFDENGNGAYEPQFGDFPIINIKGCEEFDAQWGDQNIFWIYNDAGGVHTESGGTAIQMEVQVEAFAFATNDEINDMTFYRYKLINRAIEPIDSMFFAMWTDPDLGCFRDDYVGCDTARSLMYVYNSDPLDGESSCTDCGGVATYCTEIPMLGVDYFRGPTGPKNYQIINGDTVGLVNPPVGDPGDVLVELGMSSFTYYNNGGLNPPPPNGTEDPGSATEYYNYLSGSWRDGTPFTFGGTGYNAGSTDFINFAFPVAPNIPSGWSMGQEGLAFGDRRTVQASGPFRLEPGALNELIVGVVWVPNIDHPNPSLTKLVSADDIAQDLFDNCFDLNDGPDAPDVCFLELDREIIIALSNDTLLATNNNAREAYTERPIGGGAPPELPDSLANYQFEGYLVYQLVAPNISAADFDDPEQARLIYQVDKRNGVSEIFNWSSIANPFNENDFIWTPTSMVQGADEGVQHTFQVTEDQFAESDRRLINHKKYYFSVIAYGFNEYERFDPTPPISGMRKPYIAGRRNIGPESGTPGYTVIPRPIKDRKINANFGDGPIVTRMDGIGAGNQFLRISQATREAIQKDGSIDEIVYERGGAPIIVKVYNPLDVLDGDFELSFVDGNGNDIVDSKDRWVLKNLDDPTFEVISEQTIAELNEETIADYGFSVSIGQTPDVGASDALNNGAIGFDIAYSDSAAAQWIIPVASGFGGLPTTNFIGVAAASNDAGRDLTSMSSGFFYPYVLCDYPGTIPTITPAWLNANNNVVGATFPLSGLNNVDIVMTSDKSLWSRCVVIETGSNFYTDIPGVELEGNTMNFEPRDVPSVGSDTDPNGDPGSSRGMSWFPGYAVDVETGKRLNVFFGENSAYTCLPAPLDINGCENFTSRDMIFNPGSEVFVPNNAGVVLGSYLGGQHFVYVTDEEYDGCAELAEALRIRNNPLLKAIAIGAVKWGGLWITNPEAELRSYADGIVPNDAVLSLRVDNPYKKEIATGNNEGFNQYLFSFDGVEANPVDTDEEKDSQLDAINVVPNPYYGFSAYEVNELSNIVKITNLPAKCDVTIYSLDGKFIKQYNRNEERIAKTSSAAPLLRDQVTPAIEWDLKNNKGIPVASGVYLIHIDAEGLGERVIKWFGIARQFDPTGL